MARFDDTSPAGAGFVLTAPTRIFSAHTAPEVIEALESAERAARTGHWVAGFVSYEAARAFDSSLPARSWPARHPLATLPLAWFAAFSLHTPTHLRRRNSHVVDWRLHEDRAWHRHGVETIRTAIAAGSYYQLNLTARLSAVVHQMDELYAALATAQEGHYNALINSGDHTIASASPELFFSRHGNVISTRPMKGTAARGRSADEDRERIQTLRQSEKERAENLMIVDLLRNDLSRVATAGTVAVKDLFTVETYPTVHQLTTTISARLRPRTDLVDLFSALFPSGSITGAPKRAAMLGIEQLEQGPRGVYCGAIGYLSPSGTAPAARFSVAIRTVTQDHRTGYAEYGTGGGITWPSDANAEWAELLTKTAVLSRCSEPARKLHAGSRLLPAGQGLR